MATAADLLRFSICYCFGAGNITMRSLDRCRTQNGNPWCFCAGSCWCEGEGSAPSQHPLQSSPWGGACVWACTHPYVMLNQTPSASKSSSTMPFPKKNRLIKQPPNPPIKGQNLFCLFSKRRQLTIIIRHGQGLVEKTFVLLSSLYAGKDGGEKANLKMRNARNQTELRGCDAPATGLQGKTTTPSLSIWCKRIPCLQPP